MMCPPDQLVSESREGSSHVEIPVRRFPRVGSQYQTRISSKFIEPFVRPAPIKMSANFPYIPENEAGKSESFDINARVSPLSARNSGFDPPNSKTNRGGLLIYSPTENKGELPTFVQPLIISICNQVTPQITNEAWIQHMIHLHSTETTGKNNRASRGGVKRKRAGNEALVWSLENVLKGVEENNEGIDRCGIMGEEQAVVLEHLKQCYDGNIEAAKLNILVNFSGGQAMKMRKCEKKRRTKLRIPSQHTSESWRDKYELLTFPYKVSILGQLQDDTKPCYTNRNVSPKLNDTRDLHSDMNIALEPDDSKGAWRSILACGKSIERQLNGETSLERKPLLSTLLTFIGNAYGLPPPEKCFGTHHVMIEEVSNNMISILNHVEKAQCLHAKIRDLLFDGSKEGINSDQLFKFLDSECKDLPIRLKEIDNLYKFHQIVVKWESRLETMLAAKEEESEDSEHGNYLAIAENLRDEAKGHGYISKELFLLNNRIQKAYDLRNWIFEWKRSGAEGRLSTIKIVFAFVKEAKRIKLFSPEVLEIFEIFRFAEEWIDRANIAIRSKISLDEIKALIQRGQEMPIDLSEYIDKLKKRVRIANNWLGALRNIISLKSEMCEKLQIWENLQKSLQNKNHSGLHELSSEGNRIPVDLVAVKLLQLALDAKNWTLKAQKWIPKNIDSRKGKLCDLREHKEKLSFLRSKLPLLEIDKEGWKPVGENELTSIIVAADYWLEKYKIYLEGDNRRNDERGCLSIWTLKTIVQEGNAIYVNIGNATSKISRILLQAEDWYSSHLQLLTRCGLSSDRNVVTDIHQPFITIPEMSVAVEAAKVDISVDLDEAVKLGNLLERTNNWRERVALIAPKRSKRHGRGNHSKFTIEDLIDLIEDSSNLPIDTEEDVNRLQIQLSAVETWRSKASKQLEEIVFGFHHLKSHVDAVYGEAKDYSIDQILETDNRDHEIKSKKPGSSTNGNLHNCIHNIDQKMENDMHKSNASESESTVYPEEDTTIIVRGSNSALDVLRRVKELKDSAKDINVITLEGETGELLDNMSNWFVKSFKYLNSPREIFDKRFFGAFDRFIIEGESLCSMLCGGSETHSKSSNELYKRLKQACECAISDQLVRLKIMKAERRKFEDWCLHASQILSDEKKLTHEKLADLAEKSRYFPANRDMVSKIRGLSVKVSKWIKNTRELFESGDKIDIQDAKNQMETGEKLKVHTEELKQLKAKLKAARNWSNRAKKCNLEQGSIHVSDVKQLIEEHETLLIEMPDELEVLKQATVGYCICRRPYDGFMIGCDHCEEWYHGPCIGISESKAGRFEKFTCIRCSTKKIYHNSATAAVGIIRKWTCEKDLKKARQSKNQKLQRKERKERKDADNFMSNVKDIEEQLLEFKCQEKINRASDTIMKFEAVVPAEIIFGRDSIENTKFVNRIDQSDDPSTNMVSVENGESANDTINDEGLPMCGETSSPESLKNETDDTIQNVHGLDNVKDEPTSIIFGSLEANITKDETKHISTLVLNEGELLMKLERFKATLQQSKKRLDTVSIQSQERTRIETLEDNHSTALQNWCLQVRSQVLVPSRESLSEIARPQFGVTLSPMMNQVIEKAQQLGICDLPDVRKMIDCFKSICWSLSALAIIRRKPSLSQIQYLVFEASKFKLPDEKAVRTLKFMLNRSCQWQSKIRKALAPKKGETKSINVSVLKELQYGIQELPLIIPEEHSLGIAIEDNGTRHCVCGGPSDGNFMLCCDSCNEWFHGACIHVSNSLSNTEKKWSCPACTGIEGLSIQPIQLCTNITDSTVDKKKIPTGLPIVDSQEISPYAPDPLQLWPPFGLLGSQAATEVLGPECSTIAINATAQNKVCQLQNNSSSQLMVSKTLHVSLEIRQEESQDIIMTKCLNQTKENGIKTQNFSDLISRSSQVNVPNSDMESQQQLSESQSIDLLKPQDFDQNRNNQLDNGICSKQSMNNENPEHFPDISNQV
mmetsp:Transcript_43531/g.49071  ORF Transcript_43531/g.49071 Transcript_43531/m.49071 type:complete len:1967 (-) Transcript_43531:117-6017(-)